MRSMIARWLISPKAHAQGHHYDALPAALPGFLTGTQARRLAVPGCPRNCSEAMVMDVGLVAVEGSRWEIYVGGAAGALVRKGELLATVDTADEAVILVGRLIQCYRETAHWLERTYAFMDRVGLDSVQAIVAADRDGDRARLDAGLERSLATYDDPWLEGRRPVTANQFG